MKLVKCPICELNYMAENETMCEVCKQERKKSRKKSEPVVQICPECNENPVEPGEEFCKLCLREHKRLEAIEKLALSRQTATEEDEEEEMLPEAVLPEEAPDALESIELLEEDETDIPEEELEDIEEELGLDDEDEEDGLAL